VKVNVVVWAAPPLVNVNCCVPKLPTPAGNPKAARETTPLKPFAGVMVMLYATVAPGKTDCGDDGLTLRT